MGRDDHHVEVPSGNMLLRQLSRSDLNLLQPFMESVALAPGASLFRPDARLEAVYFPSSALVSIQETGDRPQIEIALVGREGMVGWPALLGCRVPDHGAVVSTNGGSAIRIPADALNAACDASPSLRTGLLRFVHIVIIQMGHAIASHLRDPIDQRLARWLLMRHDRVVGDEILVHHAEIADHLCIRRSSVTDGMHVLEGERLIRCTRGRVLVRDRPGLERFAADSYRKIELDCDPAPTPFPGSGVLRPRLDPVPDLIAELRTGS